MYESMWLSSTWPIKVLMQGDLVLDTTRLILKTQASFEIENGATEYVRDEMEVAGDGRSFERKTLIRTSEHEEGKWLHHMTETASRVGNH